MALIHVCLEWWIIKTSPFIPETWKPTLQVVVVAVNKQDKSWYQPVAYLLTSKSWAYTFKSCLIQLLCPVEDLTSLQFLSRIWNYKAPFLPIISMINNVIFVKKCLFLRNWIACACVIYCFKKKEKKGFCHQLDSNEFWRN